MKQKTTLIKSIIISALVIAGALWFRAPVAGILLLAAIWLKFVYRHKYFVSSNQFKDRFPLAATFIKGIGFLVLGLALGIISYRFVFELIQVPSASMEAAIPSGKYIGVNKLVPGPRRHPEEVGKYFRMGGIDKLKRGDIILFNFPEGDTILENRPTESYYYLRRHFNEFDRLREIRQWGQLIALQVKERPRFVKRLVALPGDTIQITNNSLHINGQANQFQPTLIKKYRWIGTREAYTQLLEELHIVNQYTTSGNIEVEMTSGDYAQLSPTITTRLKSFFLERNVPDRHVFPFEPGLGWNTHQMGPVIVPSRGDTIEITPENLPFYERAIRVYENNDLKSVDQKIFLNGKATSSYTFKMNYYWVMGDNRPHSFDSRFWGFLPENHIIGKIPGVLTR